MVGPDWECYLHTCPFVKAALTHVSACAALGADRGSHGFQSRAVMSQRQEHWSLVTF